MNHKEFDKLLKEILERTTRVLSTKSDEYSTDEDKLWNFKRAGKMLNCTPEKALIGMAAKHFISILDIVDEIDRNYSIQTSKFPMIEEKITDAINYLILLEALIKE